MEVAEAAVVGIKSVLPQCEVVKVAVADGGEGTVDALTSALSGVTVAVTVCDPLMRPVRASYGMSGDLAFMEMSAASGLPLLSLEERNPMLTSTFGTGEMILDAARRGCRRFLVGIGGSATNDGGTGMLTALGVKFLDSGGRALTGTGANLAAITSIDISGIDPAVAESSFIVACDVDTPFCGPEGAACVFAQQKGATPGQVAALDLGMRSLADVVMSSLEKDITSIRGAGAAGGLGGAFYAFLGAELKQGVDMVLDAIGFDQLIVGADLVITGEGKIDSQTARGKTACGVLRHAQKQGIDVAAIGGCVERCPEVEAMGFAHIAAISEGQPLEVAMRPEVAAANIARAVGALIKRCS